MSVKLSFESLDPCCEPFAFSLPRRSAAGWARMQCLDLLSHGADDQLPVSVNVRDHHKSVAELFFFQPFTDHFERGLLLADYEKRFSSADRVSNHIYDCLALARTR